MALSYGYPTGSRVMAWEECLGNRILPYGSASGPRLGGGAMTEQAVGLLPPGSRAPNKQERVLDGLRDQERSYGRSRKKESCRDKTMTGDGQTSHED